MSRSRFLTGTGNEAGPALLRMAVSLSAAVDGVRALRLHAHIGDSRLSELLPAALVAPAALAELVASALLAIGLFTRPAAALNLGLATVCGVIAFKQIGGLGSAAAIDHFVHATLVGGASVCLLCVGPGRWSADALSPARRSRS